MTRDFATSHVTSDTSSRLRWGRIIGGAFLLELVLIIVLVPPLQFIGPKMIPFVYPGVLVFGFLVTWWILRKVPQRPVLHGALIGIVATAIYVGLCLMNPDGIQSVIDLYGLFGFIAGNALRTIGCMAAGFVLRNRAQ